MKVGGQHHTQERTLVPIKYDAGWALQTGWMFRRREKSLSASGPSVHSSSQWLNFIPHWTAQYRKTVHVSLKALVHTFQFSISRNDLRHSFFFVIKPTRCTNFTNLFCYETLHASDSSGVYSLYTQQWCMSYRFVDSCLQTCMTYTIVECTVNKLLMMDRRTVRSM
jgi:hypothetical protein